MRRALADRLLELRTLSRLANELGVSVATAGRLVRRGPPQKWSEARLIAFAEAVYARAHVADQGRDPAQRAALERRRHEPIYAPEAQVAVAQALARALLALERRRPCEHGNWSPRASLASELGIGSKRLGRWLEAGRVPQSFMGPASAWAQARAEQELRRIAEQGHVEALIEEARTPAYEHTLPGAPRKFAARVPSFRTGHGRTESEQQSGYQWALRVETWSTFELIDRLCEWAGSRRRPAGMRSAGRNWIVTALCTIYHPQGRNMKGKRKSPGAIRQFDRPADRQRGKNLSINVPVSSCSIHRGGLERAVSLFRETMTIEHCENEQIYVHGIFVRNWRDRTPRERKNYRDRVSARLANEAALRERSQAADRAHKREQAKQRALGRRGSRAAKASLGARTGRKKRR